MYDNSQQVFPMGNTKSLRLEQTRNWTKQGSLLLVFHIRVVLILPQLLLLLVSVMRWKRRGSSRFINADCWIRDGLRDIFRLLPWHMRQEKRVLPSNIVSIINVHSTTMYGKAFDWTEEGGKRLGRQICNCRPRTEGGGGKQTSRRMMWWLRPRCMQSQR